ncbi:MAG: hypothetical protein RIR26_197, partial [Pseudomonadota bacterium]
MKRGIHPNQSKWIKLLFIAGIFFSFQSRQVFAAGLKVGTNFSFLQFTKKSDDGVVSGSAPLGFSATGTYFFADRFSAEVSGDINMELTKTTAVFLGGDASVGYYLAGGALKRIEGETFTAHSAPKFNAMVFAGAGGSAFNFNAFNTSRDKVTKRAQNNVLRGSVLGVVVGAGVSIGITRELLFRVQSKVFNGLRDEVTPSITTIGFGGGLE